LKLYVFPVAPNPTRLRLYIAEKRAADGAFELEIEEVMVNLREQEQKTPDHLKRNRLGKLPVLETEDGVYLTESLAIIEYLEELAPEPPMIGATPFDRARTRELERIIEMGVLRPIAEIGHATASPLGYPPKPAIETYFREQLPAALDILEERLGDGRPLLMGDSPSIADCSLAAALQFGRMGKLEIDPSLANIARWDAEFRKRPSAQQVLVL
jgi:glutathione S-transferase